MTRKKNAAVSEVRFAGLKVDGKDVEEADASKPHTLVYSAPAPDDTRVVFGTSGSQDGFDPEWAKRYDFVGNDFPGIFRAFMDGCPSGEYVHAADYDALLTLYQTKIRLIREAIDDFKLIGRVPSKEIIEILDQEG
jgi:hypothetical protein